MIVDHHTRRLSTDDMMTARMHANHIQINRLFGIISCINENIAVFAFIHLNSAEATNPRKATIPSKNNRNGIAR